MGGFPSGQRGQTVNLLALPSKVRIHLFPPKKRHRNAVSFFMRGIVDSARFTPRGALRLNHLFGADAPLMQVNLPVPLLNESTSSHQKRKHRNSDAFFFCAKESV